MSGLYEGLVRDIRGRPHGAPVCRRQLLRCQVDKRDERGAAMAERTSFTSDEARRVGSEIGIDWASAPFDVEQLRMGMDVELEHGLQDPVTDVTGSDPEVTGKIALAHLHEFPEYSTRLARMEAEAKRDGAH